jgi:hypothetical protein
MTDTDTATRYRTAVPIPTRCNPVSHPTTRAGCTDAPRAHIQGTTPTYRCDTLGHDIGHSGGCTRIRLAARGAPRAYSAPIPSRHIHVRYRADTRRPVFDASYRHVCAGHSIDNRQTGHRNRRTG